MTANEIVIANLKRISDIYTDIAELTDLKAKADNDFESETRDAYNRAIWGFNDAIENLLYVNKALEDV